MEKPMTKTILILGTFTLLYIYAVYPTVFEGLIYRRKNSETEDLLRLAEDTRLSLNLYSNIYGLSKKVINNLTDSKNILYVKNIRSLCTSANLKMHSSYVLSYALYRSSRNKTYESYINSVINEVRSSTFYSNWTVRIYHDLSEVESEVYSRHENIFFCDVRQTPYLGDLSYIDGMMWRFLPVGDLKVDVVCSRDLDSPLLEREEDAVNEWLKGPKMFHVMRDHILHSSTIMGGLWCIKTYKNRLLAEMLFSLALAKSVRRTSEIMPPYGSDQATLNKYIWPFIKNDVLIHDSYRCNSNTAPFPTKRKQNHLFVGCTRPCKIRKIDICPVKCRPTEHKDWLFC